MDILEVLRDHGIGAGRRLTGTAVAGDIRSGKTALNASGDVTGTLVTRDSGGAVAVTPGTATQTLNAGIYDYNISIAGDADLISANIKAGINIFGVAGNANVVDTTEGTNPITAALVYPGKIGFVNGVKITGTMATKAAATITPGTTDQTIAASQYLTEVQTISGDADLVNTNIKAGVNIFGVAGTFTADATAAASDILTGKTGYVNGAKITGTRGVISPTYQDQYTAIGTTVTTPADTGVLNAYLQIPPDSVMSGINWVRSPQPNLLAGNIKSGVSIFGVAGSALTVDYCSQISGLSASVGYSTAGQVTLSWANPADGKIKGVRIMYKTGSYPTSPTDGTVFYDSNDGAIATTATVTGLTEGTAYYIRAFAYTYQNATRLYQTSTSGAQVTATPYRAQGQIVYTSADTFTVPYGVTSVAIFCVGGGGGGLVSGRSGGGGGGYTATRKAYPVTPGQQFSIAIGAGSTAGQGGTTSFGGSVLTATGGYSCTDYTYNSVQRSKGGNGGSGGGGDDSYSGNGNGGADGASGASYGNFSGASSFTGGTGQGTTTRAFAEAGNTLYAGGGAGGYSTNGVGGAGGGGAPGANGTAGTGGGGGKYYNSVVGTGASGVCIVRWGY